jgi:hypothetical protein
MKYVAIVILFLCSAFAFAGEKRRHRFAHVHGEAQLSIAIDGKKMEILFQTPADGVFGFEHEPRTEAEKKVVEQGKAKIKTAALKMIKIPEKFKCNSGVSRLDVTLAQLRRTRREEQLGQPATPKGHGDIKVIYEVTCESPLKGVSLQINVAKHFARIKKTRVVVLSDAKQWSDMVESKTVSVEL